MLGDCVDSAHVVSAEIRDVKVTRVVECSSTRVVKTRVRYVAAISARALEARSVTLDQAGAEIDTPDLVRRRFPKAHTGTMDCELTRAADARGKSRTTIA